MNEEPTFLTKLARGAVAFLRSPIGDAIVGAGLIAIGGPFGGLLKRFGTEGLASALEHITTETFTDADVENALATKGYKVKPFNPTDLNG